MDSRRVSLPAALAVSRGYNTTYQLHHRHISSSAAEEEEEAAPTMLLSPHLSPNSFQRRSLPSTPLPNGTRRSLPPTPPTPAFSSNSDQEDEQEMQPINPRNTRMRSFDLRDGHLLDKGFQKIPKEQQNLECLSRNDTRRATCPEIFLFDSQNCLMKHVVLRIYGARNCGKKSLANRIHHLATSMTPERVDPEENGNDFSRITTFLLNGKEITLEILLESSLENSPFRQSAIMYIAMYNVDSRPSFIYATQILERIYLANKMNPNVQAFLVANKIDLVRNQVISSAEGRSAARAFNCEYLEVSALLGMNTEETWKAILQQIEEPTQKRRLSWVERLLNKGKGVAKSAEEIFQNLF